MNSGCYGTDISKILLSIKVIDEKGKKKKFLTKILIMVTEDPLSLRIILFTAILKGSNSPKIQSKRNRKN